MFHKRQGTLLLVKCQKNYAAWSWLVVCTSIYRKKKHKTLNEVYLKSCCLITVGNRLRIVILLNDYVFLFVFSQGSSTDKQFLVPYTLISYNNDLLIQLVDFLVQSPQAVSPSTLSPTSLSSRQMGRFSFGGSPQDSQGPSPGHSPSTRRRQYPQHLQNLVIGGPQSPTQLTQTAVSFEKCHQEFRFCMYHIWWNMVGNVTIRHLAAFKRVCVIHNR